MTNETRNLQPSAAPQKQALLEAFDTVLKQQAEEREAEQREAEARRRSRAPRAPGRSGARGRARRCSSAPICTSSGRSGSSPTASPESVAIKEASLRIGMANVGAARRAIPPADRRSARAACSRPARHGRGDRPTSRSDSDGWRLVGTNGRRRAHAHARSEPLPRFLGNSFEVISRRPPMSRRRGFTFIEVLVVMIVIRILATPRRSSSTSTSSTARCRPAPWPTSRRSAWRPTAPGTSTARGRPKPAPGRCRPASTPYLPGGFTLLQAGVHARLGQLRAPGRRTDRRHAARRGA